MDAISGETFDVTVSRQQVQFYNPDRKHPYAQRWSVGVQQLLPWRFVGEATYVGNRGRHLIRQPDVNRVP